MIEFYFFYKSKIYPYFQFFLASTINCSCEIILSEKKIIMNIKSSLNVFFFPLSQESDYLNNEK